MKLSLLFILFFIEILSAQWYQFQLGPSYKSRRAGVKRQGQGQNRGQGRGRFNSRQNQQSDNIQHVFRPGRNSRTTTRNTHGINLQDFGLHLGQVNRLTENLRNVGLGIPNVHNGRSRTQVPDCWLSEAPLCNANARYRTIDGSCNNLNNPTWGQSLQKLVRLLDPIYEDGVGEIRTHSHISGRKLPSTRLVTTTVTRIAVQQKDEDRRLSNLHMTWGQFIDHDLTHTPMVPKVDCCNRPFNPRADDCITIDVAANDPFWGRKGLRCMELRRSMGITPGQCSGTQDSQWREQVNNLTAYMDGGLVYGSTREKLNLLRAFRGGLLKTSSGNLLPIDPRRSGLECDIPRTSPDKRCFLAGDQRPNVWSGLTSLHLVFVQEHNRIARIFYRQLRSRNPRMSKKRLDEITFQEARRVVVALFQVITYKEYLPNVLGKREMARHGLNLGQGHYNPNVRADASNVFATAAFRFGHTEISFGTQPLKSNFRNATVFQNMEDLFNDPAKYRIIGQFDSLRGIALEPALNFNTLFAEEVRNKLFSFTFDNKGLDLPAVNMQRAREHGLPGYNAFRRWCKLPVAHDFSDLIDIPYQQQRDLSRVYDHVDDIDLFIAAVSERIVSHDAHVGPVFACLLADQFKKFKDGDRFWFEYQDTYPNPFSAEQIRQLKQQTMTRVACSNLPDSDYLIENMFKHNSRLVRCDSLPSLDLYNWFEL